MNHVITAHAAVEMHRRGISEMVVQQILENPEQRIAGDRRDVLQMDGRQYLVRVFVDIDRDPPEVVTVYRTSKIAKYWRSEK